MLKYDIFVSFADSYRQSYPRVTKTFIFYIFFYFFIEASAISTSWQVSKLTVLFLRTKLLRIWLAVFGNVIVNYLFYINLTSFGITFELWKICKKHTKHLGIYHCVCMPVSILVHNDHYWLANSLVPAPQHTHPRSNVTNQWFVNFSNTIIFNFLIIVKEIWTKCVGNLSISEGNFGLKWENSK